MLGASVFLALHGWGTADTGIRLDVPFGYLAANPHPAAPTSIPPPSDRASQADQCPSDCVNFDAGYAWAKERGFSAEEQCRGKSEAFLDGCKIFVAEQASCGGTCR
jgi:hypothetical protein